MHDFLASRLGEKQEKFRRVAFSLAIGSFVGIILIDILIGLLLFFLLIPADTPEQTQYAVNASAAQAGRPGCVKWTDVTQYPDAGLPLRQYADYATFFIKPGPPGMRPLNGSQLYNLTLQLQCVAPDIPHTAISGATQSLVENFYGGWEIVGALQTPCTTPDAPQFLAYQSASDFSTNCQSGTERAKTLERYLRSTMPNVTDYPSMWGTDCKIKNSYAYPRHMMFRTWWHWPTVPNRPGFYGMVYVMCDGLMGVQVDFKNTYARDMTSSELSTYNSTGYLCTQYVGSNCVFFYSYRQWGKTFMEHVRITFDQLDCGKTMKFGTGYPQWVLDRCASLQTTTSPNFVGLATYRHLQDPTQGQTSGGDISLAVNLMTMLFDSPRSQNAPDISYLPLACPGRVSMLSEPIYSGSSRGKFNLLTLENIMSQYDSTPMYTFLCVVMVPPTLVQRASYIWPYLSVAHTIVMTYMMRYVYLACVKVRNWCYGYNIEQEEQDEEDRARSEQESPRTKNEERAEKLTCCVLNIDRDPEANIESPSARTPHSVYWGENYDGTKITHAQILEEAMNAIVVSPAQSFRQGPLSPTQSSGQGQFSPAAAGQPNRRNVQIGMNAQL